MSAMSVTEDLILNATGKECIKDVKKLRLGDMGLTDLDPSVFHKMIHLNHLDISMNNLKSVPNNLGLPNLRTLDCSDNTLTCVLFLEQFPKLENLFIENNRLTSSDRYIAAVLCPSLQIVDRNKRTSLDKFITCTKQKLESEVQDLWENTYASRLCGDTSLREEAQLVRDMSRVVKKRKHASAGNEKFHDFMIELLIKEQIKSVKNQTSEPAAKRSRVSFRSDVCDSSPVSSPSPRKSPWHSAQSPSSASPLRSPSSRICAQDNEKNKLAGSPSPSKSSPRKHKHAASKKYNSKICSSLPPVPEYEPAHFIRCHFNGSKDYIDNDPADNATIVWMSSFEPDPYRPEKQTGLVATCGGSSICLIDCKTGHVMKRYKHDAKLFHFYCIAWTTIEMQSKGRTWPTNILAAGGEKDIVTLLHPEQLVCYHQFKATKHNSAFVSSLLFHPEHPTRLFCGSKDGTISLWDIGIPSGKEYTTKSRHLQSFSSPDGSCVIDMIISKVTNHLLGACDNGLYAWKLTKELKKVSTWQPSVELVLPDPDSLSSDEEEDDVCVDGLCMVAEDLVAVKMKHNSTIHLFKLSAVLERKGRKVKVDPSASLMWCKTDQYYLNMGCSDGLLTCGDDNGNIRLYDVSGFVQNNDLLAADNLDPSMILEWPHCDLEGKKDKLMTDLKEKEEEIIINYLSVSQERNYIVGVTDNNLVCIWRKS